MTERSRWAFPRLARVAAVWAAAVVLGAGVLAAQGTTGKIEGTVRDQSGAPINGAQVFVVGTSFQAVSNERGYYFINNVPAGVMTVRAQYIGYQPSEVRNVRVFAGQTMTVNVPLEARAIEVAGVTVTVEQTPIVPRDQVASRPIVQGDVIQALPVDQVAQVLRLQPGVVEGRGGALSIRGGRPGETATYIDGVLVRSLTGANSATVGTNALEEAAVTTGAVGAEYGEAQSGVVALVTRSGGQRHRGNFSFSTDDVFGETIGTGQNRIEASIGGPVARNLTYFVAATLDAAQNGRRPVGAEDVPVWVMNGYDDSLRVARTPGVATSDTQVVYLPNFVRYSEGGRLPRAHNSSYNLDANVQYTFGSGSRVRLTMHQTAAFTMNYPGRNQLYNSVSSRGRYDLSRALILNWTQNLAQSTERALFLDATFSWQRDTNTQSYFTPDWNADHLAPFGSFAAFSRPDFIIDENNFPIDEELIRNIRLDDCYGDRSFGIGNCFPTLERQDLAGATEYRFNPFGVSGSPTYFPTTGVFARGGITLNEETRYAGRVNFDWQANRYNRVRFGGDFIKADLNFYQTNGMQNRIFMDAYIEHPLRYGVYANDRIDLGDVVIDLGLRYDRLDSKIKYPRVPGRVYSDPIRTGGYERAFSATDSAMADACRAATAANDLDALATCNYFTADARGMLAPSVRVSFPVTERTGFRLSYAHQLQTPLFQWLATGNQADLNYTNTNDTFSRDLDFGKSIVFEFGIRHSFNDDMVLDISAYNRDQVSDITARTMPIYDPYRNENQAVNLLTNLDFGNVRGMDVRLDRRIGQLFQGSVVYTYQNARTTGSDPNEYLNTIARQISSVTGDRAPAPQAMLPHADNRTHTVAGNVAVNFPHGWRSGTTLGRLLQDFGVTGTFRFQSGLPYTRFMINDGSGVTGPGGNLNNAPWVGTERLNAARMPWIKNVDLRVTRALQVAGRDLTLFADFRNLFNWTNWAFIFAETGDVVNSQLRDETISPIITELLQEAGTLVEYRDLDVDGVATRTRGINLEDCAAYAPTRYYGRVNCIMLRRTEARFAIGESDQFLSEAEYRRAYTAWYDQNNGAYSNYGAGRNIRIGFELNF